MYKILLSIFGLGIILGTQAQDGEYDKILAMLVNEDYEKVIYKAESFTLKDDTKKDPIPYLYMSMAYFEMSKRGEFAEEYPKAFKESLKYASKHRKKDKENEYYSEFSDFFSELRAAAMVEAEVSLDQEKYTTAKGTYRYIVSLDESDPGALLMQGYTEMMMKAKKDAETSITTAREILDTKGIDHLAKEQIELLKTGIMNVSEAYDQQGMRAEAKDWMETGKKYFDGDKEFMGAYRSIVG